MADLPVLKEGSTGNDVLWLQRNLIGLGYNFNGLTADGVFGPTTKQSVGSFQDEYKLPRDGIVGPVTWKVLLDNIRAVQRLLNARGYSVGTPDGWFGPSTVDAVMRFQRDQGLYPEGIINPRTRWRLFNPYPKVNWENRPTSDTIDALNPRVATMARRFLELTKENGMDVRITSVFRSWDDQDKLFAQGRTAPGPIVTNTRGGESYHNWGLAFDAAPYVNGVISNDTALYQKMGRIGEEAGLEWGGTFKDIVDLPHFQQTFGLSTEDLLNGVTPPS